MRCERDVGEPQPRTEDESPGAGRARISSPAILQRYQGPQAASWRQGVTAQRYLDIGLSERGQMRVWWLCGRDGTLQVQWNRSARGEPPSEEAGG
jgi:hypothetical protein